MKKSRLKRVKHSRRARHSAAMKLAIENRKGAEKKKQNLPGGACQ